jgi:7-keto-8-aminopelargonate synthetase-like enzyme
MLGDAQLATNMADKLLAEGVYVIGFSFPVVPRGRTDPHADERRTYRRTDRPDRGRVRARRQVARHRLTEVRP